MAKCLKCGSELPDGVSFCVSCGAAVESAQLPPIAPPPIQPSPQPQQVGQAGAPQFRQPPPQNTYSPQQRPGVPPPPPQYRDPYNNQYSPQYRQPDMQQSMSVGGYVATILLSAIPIAGFILLIVWACGNSKFPERVKWSRAELIIMAIGMAFTFLIIMLAGAAFASFFDELSYYARNFY